MNRPRSIWITATRFGELTGFTKKQAYDFRKLNEGKGLFKRKDSGQFLYDAAKIPQSLIKQTA